MKYTFTCPANDGFVSVVEAANDDEAVAKLIEAGKEHAATVHADMQGMPAEQVKAMIMAGWKKG
jgi:hypothetical protein